MEEAGSCWTDKPHGVKLYPSHSGTLLGGHVPWGGIKGLPTPGEPQTPRDTGQQEEHWSCMIPGPPYPCSPSESGHEWFLSTELGVSPEYSWVCSTIINKCNEKEEPTSWFLYSGTGHSCYFISTYYINYWKKQTTNSKIYQSIVCTLLIIIIILCISLLGLILVPTYKQIYTILLNAVASSELEKLTMYLPSFETLRGKKKATLNFPNYHIWTLMPS